MYWSRFNFLSHFFHAVKSFYKQLTLRTQCLNWRYVTHLNSIHLCGCLKVKKKISSDHKIIPKASRHPTLVADFFACSAFPFTLCWSALHEFDRRKSLLPLQAVCFVCLFLFSSLLCTWFAFKSSFLPFFFALKATAFLSVKTLRYLNGVKQMWWAEHQFTGHWSLCYQPLHLACCYCIKETGVLYIRFYCCNAEEHGSELRDRNDRFVSLGCFSAMWRLCLLNTFLYSIF